MQRRTLWLLWGALCLLALVSLVWLAAHRGPPASLDDGGDALAITNSTVVTNTEASTAIIPATPPVVIEPKPYRPEATLVEANPAWVGDREKQRAEVRTVLQELKALYGHVGALPLEDARQLMTQRRAAEEALVQRLAALGPGGARAMQENLSPALDVRAQLLLARALGLIDDPEAAAVTGELLAGDGSFSLRKTLVASLGQRFDDAGATEVLRNTLSADADAQLRYAAAQALSGRPAAVETLVRRIEQDPDKTVRLEAIRAVGLTASEAGQAALLAVAQNNSQELIVRQTAIQELRRSYGTKAWTALQGLRQNADAAIRTSAEKALSMLGGKPGEAAVSSVPQR